MLQKTAEGHTEQHNERDARQFLSTADFAILSALLQKKYSSKGTK
jgi:hypothetical protein